MIGTLSDTKTRDGLKWFLFVLIIMGAGAGGAREYFLDKTLKKNQKTLNDAVAVAERADKVVVERISKNEQACAKEREGLESAVKQSRASSMALIEQITALADSIQKMEEAAVEARKEEIAEIGMKARLDASTKLVATAKEGEWMTPTQITNLEAWFKEELPLQTKHFDEIKESLGPKSLSGGDATD